MNVTMVQVCFRIRCLQTNGKIVLVESEEVVSMNLHVTTEKVPHFGALCSESYRTTQRVEQILLTICLGLFYSSTGCSFLSDQEGTLFISRN